MYSSIALWEKSSKTLFMDQSEVQHRPGQVIKVNVKIENFVNKHFCSGDDLNLKMESSL